MKEKLTSGIIMSDLSDHLPIFIVTDFNVYRKMNDNDDIEVRQFTNENMNTFKTELRKVEWDRVCDSNDTNILYTKFISKFNEVFDKCIPQKKKRVCSNKSKPRSPWITFGLLKSIRRKYFVW